MKVYIFRGSTAGLNLTVKINKINSKISKHAVNKTHEPKNSSENPNHTF